MHRRMNQQRAALVAIAVVIPLAMAATVYTGMPRQQQQEEGPAGGSREKLSVVTSFYPLYDFASHVAGDRAEVSSLVPPGIEPHDWEPSVGDVARAREADMLVINGAGFESWVDGIDAKRLVNTSAGIELVATGDRQHEGEGEGGEDEHEAWGVDPHVWLDPVLAKKQVDAIRFSLAMADPANASYYNDNAARYAAELDELDAFVREELASCEKSDFIAFHDAFSRFADRYGLTQHAIHGVSPEGEVLPQRLQEVVELARELGIDTVYSEEAADPRLAQVVADEIQGGRVLVLSPVEGIDSEEQAAGIGYIEKMRENVASLKEGLKCRR